MPLIHSGSDPALRKNIGTLMHDVGRSPHVQSREQALAIAFANQRRHRDTGGGLGLGQSPFVNPLAAPTGRFNEPALTPTPAPTPPPPPQTGVATSAPDVSTPPSGTFNGPSTGIAPPGRYGGTASPNAGSPFDALNNVLGQTGLGSIQDVVTRAGLSPFMNGINIPGLWQTGSGNMGARAPGMAGGGMAPPWYVRSEARQMAHTGPIQSHVAGRTDHIPLNVPVGSYVIPADIVSGRGQGNSAAGLKLMHNMFAAGPFGSSMPKIGHGAGPPKPPAMRGVGAAGIKAPRGFAEGGAPEEPDEYQETGETVPIMAAGGEYVVHPKTVWMIGGKDIDLGHRILDQWVKDERQSLIKTLKKLPGPAKD